MIDFRNEYFRRILCAADTSGGQHPSGRCVNSAHRYAVLFIHFCLLDYHFNVTLLRFHLCCLFIIIN